MSHAATLRARLDQAATRYTQALKDADAARALAHQEAEESLAATRAQLLSEALDLLDDKPVAAEPPKPTPRKAAPVKAPGPELVEPEPLAAPGPKPANGSTAGLF